MDSLKEVLLTSIDKTLDSQEFYNGLDNSHWKDWTEQQKFDGLSSFIKLLLVDITQVNHI